MRIVERRIDMTASKGVEFEVKKKRDELAG